jgi:hypothetical protein
VVERSIAVGRQQVREQVRADAAVRIARERDHAELTERVGSPATADGSARS